MFEWISHPEAWIALLTLTGLEIVLGIDNIIFISILVNKLPASQREKAKKIGLMLAMGTRLGLLASLAWIMTLTTDLFTVLGNGISGRDLILLIGGAFLVGKSAIEIHHSLKPEMDGSQDGDKVKTASFGMILIQIAILDLVFSIDSVISAVGLSGQLSIMAIAVVASVGVMMLCAKSIGDFVSNNPSIKMLAMAFLVIVGAVLVAEGLDIHVPKGYVYFAMAFSLAVELLNIKRAKNIATEAEESNALVAQ